MEKNTKIGMKIVLYMLLGGAVGMLGAMSAFNTDVLSSLGNLGEIIIENGYYIFWAWTGIYLLATSLFYILGKSKLKSSLEADDPIIDDSILSLGLIATKVGYYLSIALYMITMQGMETLVWEQILAGTIAFLLTALYYAFIQHKYINIVKSYNPEKEGEVSDLDFNKKWLGSSDEREQQEIFEAGYHAYIVSQSVGFVLLILTGLYSMITETGIHSTVVVLIILVVTDLSYYYSAAKKEKARKEKYMASN